MPRGPHAARPPGGRRGWPIWRPSPWRSPCCGTCTRAWRRCCRTCTGRRASPATPPSAGSEPPMLPNQFDQGLSPDQDYQAELPVLPLRPVRQETTQTAVRVSLAMEPGTVTALIGPRAEADPPTARSSWPPTRRPAISRRRARPSRCLARRTTRERPTTCTAGSGSGKRRRGVSCAGIWGMGTSAPGPAALSWASGAPAVSGGASA